MSTIKSEYIRHSFKSNNKPSIENKHGRIVKINFIEIHPTVIRLETKESKKIICLRIIGELISKYSEKHINAKLDEDLMYNEFLWAEIDCRRTEIRLQIQLTLDENIYLLKVSTIT